MIKLWFSRVALALLTIAILIDGSLLIDVKYHYAVASSKVLYASGLAEPVPPPLGYPASGRGPSSSGSDKAGWVIRYASRNCEFCRKDELLWAPLMSELQQRGVRVIILLPSAADQYADGAAESRGAQQEAYIDTGWIGKFRLTMTPTLMLFDSQGNLIWSHQGVMDPGDPASAIRALDTSQETSLTSGSQNLGYPL